ncbi:MAG: hypothetical protein RSA86_05545 [Christensenellaceae bacterium]
MSKLLEDTINFGMGLFAYSREKIEEIVEKMVDKGEVARKDAQGFASDLVKKGDEQRKELRHIINSEIKETLNETGLASGITKEDIRQIVREEMDKK